MPFLNAKDAAILNAISLSLLDDMNHQIILPLHLQQDIQLKYRYSVIL